jgi:hypothetical protein
MPIEAWIFSKTELASSTAFMATTTLPATELKQFTFSFF